MKLRLHIAVVNFWHGHIFDLHLLVPTMPPLSLLMTIKENEAASFVTSKYLKRLESLLASVDCGTITLCTASIPSSLCVSTGKYSGAQWPTKWHLVPFLPSLILG